jgi:hypothetical protein
VAVTEMAIRADDAGPRHASEVLGGGATFGIGSLPHRHVGAAARFAIDAFAIPTVPTLPRRTPAESAVAQALVGVPGVSLGPYGTIAVDPEQLDAGRPVSTDLDGPGFGGLRAFVDAMTDRPAQPVKWQFLGPISVGLALVRAGADRSVAFDVALAAVRSRLRVIESYLATRLPDCPQIVLVDEPFADSVLDARFPIAPDEAVDLVSGALAALAPTTMAGVHACTGADLPTLVATGAQILSAPVDAITTDIAGYVDRFIEAGGWIAWGAVTTSGPIGAGQPRAWQRLAERLCQLVTSGCDADRLQAQSFLTPTCGLGHHATAVAEHVAEALRETSLSLRSEASAARFVLGA